MSFQIPTVESQLTEQTLGGLAPYMFNGLHFALDSCSQVDHGNDPGPQPGFPGWEQWRGWFENNGFTQISDMADIEVFRDQYQRFFTGVVCGRGTAP